MATLAPSGRSPDAGAPTASDGEDRQVVDRVQLFEGAVVGRGRLGAQVGVDVGAVLDRCGVGGRLRGRRLLQLRLGGGVGSRRRSFGAGIRRSGRRCPHWRRSAVSPLVSSLTVLRRTSPPASTTTSPAAAMPSHPGDCAHRRFVERRAGDDMAATPAAAAPSAPVGVESRSAPVRSLSGSRSQASSAAARCRSRMEIGASSADDACETMARTVRSRSTSASSSADVLDQGAFVGGHVAVEIRARQDGQVVIHSGWFGRSRSSSKFPRIVRKSRRDVLSVGQWMQRRQQIEAQRLGQLGSGRGRCVT